MSRWLVVGATGMLGQDLVGALGAARDPHEVTAVDRDVLDVINAAERRLSKTEAALITLVKTHALEEIFESAREQPKPKKH